jgi:hypothetical protein
MINRIMGKRENEREQQQTIYDSGDIEVGNGKTHSDQGSEKLLDTSTKKRWPLMVDSVAVRV